MGPRDTMVNNGTLEALVYGRQNVSNTLLLPRSAKQYPFHVLGVM